MIKFCEHGSHAYIGLYCIHKRYFMLFSWNQRWQNYDTGNPKIICLLVKYSVLGSLETLPRLKAVSRGSFFTVLVLVLHLLSCSCASRPRQFKTPVEKRQQLIDSPETLLAKYLINCSDDFDPDEQPAVYILLQFHGLWPLFSRLCVCLLLLDR